MEIPKLNECDVSAVSLREIGFGRKNMPEALDKLRDFLNFCKVKT